MNRSDRAMLRFTSWVAVKLLWLFWILVGAALLVSALTCYHACVGGAAA